MNYYFVGIMYGRSRTKLPYFVQIIQFDNSGQLSTKIYDKRDDFNFKINFPNTVKPV